MECKYLHIAIFMGLNFIFFQVTAQYNLPENTIWVTGYQEGINFSSGSPAVVTTSVYGGFEAKGAACDSNGNLLFYTNGDLVWDSAHNLMLNGNTLHGDPFISPDGYVGSTSQGAQIVCMPDSGNKYYLFSLAGISTKGRFTHLGQGQLFYSVINMDLNNGRGDVETSRRWLPLDTVPLLNEKMMAIPGADCNVWLLVHSSDTNRFKAYEITKNGINTVPVISYTGVTVKVGSHSQGYLSVSPNGRKIAMTTISYEELFDFDPATGVVSNARTLYNSTNSYSWNTYSCAFSPDNSKLYFSSGSEAIAQYDLNAPDPARTRTTITSIGVFTQLRLGPDNKIYFHAGRVSPSLARINYPDSSGAAARPERVNLLISKTNFGNDVVKAPLPDTLYEVLVDTVFCTPAGSGIPPLTFSVRQGYQFYIWDDGSTATTRTITQPGTYWVFSKDECHSRLDSFIVKQTDVSFSLGNDTNICDEPPVTLTVPVSGADYLWQNGHTDSFLTVNETGKYWVKVSKDGCTKSDTVSVTFVDIQQDLGDDIISGICDGALNTVLHAHVPTQATVLWSTGSTAPFISIDKAGIYWVKVSLSPCTGTDTIRIETELCDCDILMPNAFSPNGDGNNDVFKPILTEGCTVSGYSLNIYNRWGQLVYSSSPLAGSLEGWNGMINEKPAETGTYFYVLTLEAGTLRKKVLKRGDVVLMR